MIFSKYSKIYHHPKDNALRTLFSTRTMEAVDLPAESIHDLKSSKLSPHKKKILQSKGLLVKSAVSEKKELLGFMDEFNNTSDIFSTILVMSLDCNLGCKYCFEGTRKGKFYLSAETADDFIEFIRSRNLKGKNRLHILFYGGEPLLSTDAVIRIAGDLRKVADKKKVGFSFAFITNGTLLTRPLVKKLNPFGLKFAGITIDGPKNNHDRYRPFKSGKGSFDVIMRNVLDVCSLTDVRINGNFTRESYPEFPRLLDALIDRGITPARISSIDFSAVVNERGRFSPPDFQGGCTSSNEPWLFEASVFLREEILKRGFRTQKLLPAICEIEWKNSIVVNYDGALYKCPGLIGRKRYCVGNLKTGIRDYGTSHGLDNWKNEKCLSCCYLPLCFGGCRYMKLIRTGTMRGRDCKKTFFDHTLESFVHQDLRYGL
jgi:uncharacterized protein